MFARGIVTYHARRQLQEREIPERLVRDVIAHSARVIRIRGARHIAQKRVRWHDRDVLCRVVYERDDDVAEVITAYVTTKFQKYE